ncbi:metal-dependent hydrolase [Pseudomonadota bacterium]
MDSVTQFALGAAVGEATLGRKVGNRALVWGGICGTLPDLDVFVPLGNVVNDFVYHRSATHSLLVMALAAPVVAWAIVRIHPGTRDLYKRWWLLVYLAFATHALLDGFTAYGTQLLWPIGSTPVTWSTLFIIDPFYTLPLLVGIVAALWLSRESDRGHLINRACLAISTVYLGWSVLAKTWVDDAFTRSLAEQGIPSHSMFTTPTPFNTLLWRAVVMDDNGYYEGYYSVLDDDADIEFVHYRSEQELLDGIKDHSAVQRLQWFSKGFYTVDRVEDAVVMSDLRMGVESSYVFRFQVGRISNPHPVPVEPARLPVYRDMDKLKFMLRDRVWGKTG